MMNAPRKWTKEIVRFFLLSDERWMIRGLLAIYKKQTSDEQQVEETKHHNDVGFTGADGHFMTSVAKFYQRNSYLSPKQKFLVRKKIVKYAGQLADIANGKI